MPGVKQNMRRHHSVDRAIENTVSWWFTGKKNTLLFGDCIQNDGRLQVDIPLCFETGQISISACTNSWLLAEDLHYIFH